jgi:hypothetical protein
MHSLPAVLAVLLTALSPSFSAADPPTAQARRAAQAPKIDGQLTEPAWQSAPELTGFTLVGTNQPASQQTSVRVLFDDDALYFGFTCLEDKLGEAVAQVTERDGRVFADDCVEVFLGPTHDRFNFLQFAVSLTGARFDASGDGAGVASDWDAPWEAAVSRGQDRWFAELRLPFACLQLSDKAGATWDMNLCREEKPHGELSSWAPVGERFGAPQTFGTLTGLTADFTPYYVSFGPEGQPAVAFGRNAEEALLANGGKDARKLKAELTVYPPTEAPRSAAVPVGELAPGTRRKLAMAYQVFEPGPHRLVFAVVDQDSGRQVAAFERNFSLAAVVEHSLFHSFYRDDVTVRSQLNVAEEELGACRLTATLKSAAGGDALAQRAVKPTGREVSSRLPLKGLKPGRYVVQLRFERRGKVEHEQDLDFAVLRDRPVDPLRVHPRDDLTLVVDGKPFFPLGLYEAPVTQKMIAEFKGAGFNTVCTHGGPPAAMTMALDRLAEADLKAWVVLGHNLDLSTDREKREQAVAESAGGISKHPALLVWESIDEPAWGSQSAEGLLQGYEFLRKLDPDHPVWTNHAPRNHISTLAYFNRATDIGGCDIYPVPEPQSQSNLPNKTLSVVGDEADKNRAAVNDEKPIFMVLQGFAWRALSKRDDPQAVYPTLHQQRYMAYDAILHGARGILYWGTHYMPKPSQAWADVKTIVHELSRLTPLLVAPKPAAQPKVKSDTGSVECLLRAVGGETYLVCLNNENREAKATVSGLPPKLKSLRVLYEKGRQLAVRNGATQVTLPGYGVVVATTDTTLHDSRPDYSAELKSLPAMPSAEEMREPGNAALNPSFEFDASGTNVPDLWNVRYPFSALLEGDDPHSGRRCLRLTSPDADFQPLLVQQGLGVEPNREYDLSVWLRTDGGEITGRVYAEWVLAGKFTSRVAPWTKGTTEWQQLKCRFTTTPDPAGGLYIVVQSRGKGTAWFDDVKLELVKE